MKYQLSICAVVLLTLSPLHSAQVASHAPTQLVPLKQDSASPRGKPVARVNGAVLTDRDLHARNVHYVSLCAQHNGQILRKWSRRSATAR